MITKGGWVCPVSGRCGFVEVAPDVDLTIPVFVSALVLFYLVIILLAAIDYRRT